MLKIHTDWLSNAEKILGSFKHPSKIVERVLQQMHEHKVSGFEPHLENSFMTNNLTSFGHPRTFPIFNSHVFVITT